MTSLTSLSALFSGGKLVDVSKTFDGIRFDFEDGRSFCVHIQGNKMFADIVHLEEETIEHVASWVNE